MGILDPDGFAGGALRLDAELARRAFESLDTPLALRAARRLRVPDRGGEHRRGGDERRRSATASTRATSRSSPTAPPARCCCRRRSTCCTCGASSSRRTRGSSPRSGCSAPTSSTTTSRSAYVPLLPESAPQIAAVFEEMERRCASAAGQRRRRCAAASTGGCFGQSWETPFVQVPDGPITARRSPTLVERFHETYERRYGNRFPYVPVQGVTYRVELRVPSEKVEFAPRAAASGAPRRRRPGRSSCATSRDEPLEAAEYDRERAAGRRAHRRPGGDPRGALDHLRRARARRPRSAASASS